MQLPQISVVMSVRNGAPFLQPAIDSLLQQDFTNFEFLIVDDGSTDQTPEILRSQSDRRIRVFHREPSGLPASLNFAVQQSKAPWIARQDADDLSEPSRLRLLLAKLTGRPNAVLAHSACYFEPESGQAVPTQYAPRSQALTVLSLCTRCTVVHGSAMFRKNIFNKVGGYNETFAQSQDYDLWSRMIEAGPFAYCSEKLYRFRFHAQSVSARKADAQRAFAERIALNNCRRWFRVDEPEASRIFDFLHQPASLHSKSSWLRFIGRDLPRLPYQSAELYVWTAVQLMRAGKDMFKIGKRVLN